MPRLCLLKTTAPHRALLSPRGEPPAVVWSSHPGHPEGPWLRAAGEHRVWAWTAGSLSQRVLQHGGKAKGKGPSEPCGPSTQSLMASQRLSLCTQDPGGHGSPTVSWAKAPLPECSIASEQQCSRSTVFVSTHEQSREPCVGAVAGPGHFSPSQECPGDFQGPLRPSVETKTGQKVPLSMRRTQVALNSRVFSGQEAACGLTECWSGPLVAMEASQDTLAGVEPQASH